MTINHWYPQPRLLYAMQQRIVATFDEADWIELGYRVRVIAILEKAVARRHPDELVDYLALPAWLAEHDPHL